ncbi:uncharacterized protein Z519_08908 [Cladophialophora bantiana CBS 173.52]|uniref:Enoyl reductase (ER) domain-containing protein n=1 Tax=Cladophialophora bantiana (strain ATCC 10958 / CBS 173.52 / CDC B-1940 / NIH 8579) TaxID=1442370 RepID=A0A0D2I052_CLAB1|nr:uncharacterized protein Z519_08908 [Cladophialophora bantiana CBS 173.52]KIW90264.1 hypothetical protein Z519_08908 [Cladophialophora bantiana CBS 173.52]
MASVYQVYRRVGEKYSQILQLVEETLPPLREGDVLIKIHAVSLDYRDVNILRGGNPWAVKKDGIPVSDAAGEVLAVGPSVTRIKLGDRVKPIFDQKNSLGAGGVSMMALKLAASSGADLILTSSSDAKLEQVERLYGLGSVKTINYKTCPPVGGRGSQLTHNAGVDIIIENGGGQSLLQSLKATKHRGHVSCIGCLGGTKVDNRSEFLPLLIDHSVTMR